MKTSWFVRGDVDGFFGLFVDNLLQLMLVLFFLTTVVPLPRELVTQTILPAAGVSILVGNLFYTWQARKLAAKSGRADVTALPYGINTPSLIAYVYLIMLPVYNGALAGIEAPAAGDKAAAARLAWQAGLFACLLSGVMELLGAFVGDWLRRVTPRAALLSALAGIAITFISMGFVFQLFASPAIALIPMMLILITYASRVRLPFSLPGGLVAVAVGVGLAWLFVALGWTDWRPDAGGTALGVHVPHPVIGDALALLTSGMGWSHLAVIFPMGLFNVIGSLQNLESAEAAGDRYETRSSLAVNGAGTIVAAFLGSPFPTTIYIGHPGWKAMGARQAYSAVNGVVVALLCLLGAITAVLQVVPLEAMLGILLWIGVIITAQSFQSIPSRHALAVAVGLIPALGAWAYMLILNTLVVAGGSMVDAVGPLADKGIHLHGVIALNQGFLVSAMVLSAAMVYVIERRFLAAAAWVGAGAALSAAGVIHAYELTPFGAANRFGLMAAPKFAFGYAATALVLVGLDRWTRRTESGSTPLRPTSSPDRPDRPSADPPASSSGGT